ncbi:MAG TPA: alanine--tRNA ligase [Solirubrobacteraceae bacterium]|nr:alanine--tRNA ligase [Solirubrobacteraceae bacterium]
MTSDEIRETYLGYFASRGHTRLPSAPLVPSAFDPSTLFIIAGMQPLKPYFLGLEQPPAPTLTTCQKVFRTPDIEEVGMTTRHLTFFEMLGNFSFGDYFKQGAIEQAWELSLDGFGLDRDKIWVTVFEGDEELGLGPDEEAIEAWVAMGVPRERIVACPRKENFWQAGPTGPCGPCSELYYDRGLEWGAADDLPGGENERFLEFWNLVFMQYDLGADDAGKPTLAPLPAQNIDTGLGLNRMAIIKQDVPTVFETDQFAPLIALGRELAGSEPNDRSLRILADHSRAMTFLIADGVVPSNEDRGYALRRVMRRAIQHGRSIGMEPGFLPKFTDRVIETMGAGYPELERERAAITRWAESEEAGFGRTLEAGMTILEDIIARARERGAPAVAGEDAFRLHDTFGFPIDLTVELAAEAGFAVDRPDFERRMDDQRARGRAVVREAAGSGGVEALDGPPSEFIGYETLERRTMVAAVEDLGDGRFALKLAESPFYATGGGQVADAGAIACDSGDCDVHVIDVKRVGDDQVIVGEGSPPSAGAAVLASVDRGARTATQANHTATHLLHAALRERLGTHVRQAGSYVGPDKLRFDFSHGAALSTDDVAYVEDRVNEWILANDPVRPITTTLDEARALGAMALFGEKYGDVVRMVEIGDGSYSRELCGGTHVRSTAEIGVFKLVTETSSAANVRRIEALTGREAVALLRGHDAILRDAATALRKRPDEVSAAIAELRDKAKAAAKAASAPANGSVDVTELVARAVEIGGAPVLAEVVDAADAQTLLTIVDKAKGQLGDAAILLGTAVDGRVHLVASVAPALVQRGVRAGDIVKTAATIAGGGGGGRDTMAQAGGRDPERLPEAVAAGRAAIEAALS